MTQPKLPLKEQRAFWNDWNARAREETVGEVSRRQAEVVIAWLRALGRNDLNILDAGCGTGWFCTQLKEFGRVTGTDLADAVVDRARKRVPDVTFVAGDFMTLDLPAAPFDLIVSFEVLSHVADQPAFMKRLADLLKPNGHLMLATQNRFVLERCDVPPPGPGQIRQWVTRRQRADLLQPHFKIIKATSATPRGHGGILRVFNSLKLNGMVAAMFGDHRVTRAKEALGLGWTIIVHAQKRT